MKLGAVAWIVVALYVSVIVLSLLISSPSRRWVFVHHPKHLLAVYLRSGGSISLSEFRRTIAYYNGRSYDVNERQLARLSASFVVASVVFVVGLILWLWMVAT